MNRAFKKAASFLTALVMGASIMSAGSISASAASTRVSVTQTVKNSNKMALGFSGGVFFASDVKSATKKLTSAWGEEYEGKYLTTSSKAEYTMVTSDGKSVKVKNTIKFDKLYRVSTFGVPTELIYSENASNYYEDLAACVVVGKGKKYAGVLSSGKFLANGKYFDSIYVGYDYITAVSGKTTYVYNAAGKQLTKSTVKNLGNAIDYDAGSKTVIMSKDVKDSFRRYDITLLNKSGKAVKSFSNKINGYFEKVNGKTYLCIVSEDPNDWGGRTDYFTTDGKKASVKKSDDNNYFSELKKLDRDLKVSEVLISEEKDEYGWISNRVYDLVVTDKNGKEVYHKEMTSDNSYPRVDGKADGEPNPKYFWAGDKLLIANGDLVVIDEKTGKSETVNTEHSYCGIDGGSNNNKTFILSYLDANDGLGGYSSMNRVLVDIKGKVLSKGYSYIRPLNGSYEVYATDDGTIYFSRFTNSTTFYAYDKNDNVGLLNIKGKEIAPVYYTGIYAADANVTVFYSEKSEKYDIRDNSTGKKYLGSLTFPSWTNDIWGMYREVPRYRSLGKNANRIITSNKAGSKLGCVVVSTK